MTKPNPHYCRVSRCRWPQAMSIRPTHLIHKLNVFTVTK